MWDIPYRNAPDSTIGRFIKSNHLRRPTNLLDEMEEFLVCAHHLDDGSPSPADPCCGADEKAIATWTADVKDNKGWTILTDGAMNRSTFHDLPFRYTVRSDLLGRPSHPEYNDALVGNAIRRLREQVCSLSLSLSNNTTLWDEARS